MTQQAGTRNITASMAPWVDAAIERYAPGEDLSWETSILVGPAAGGGVVLLLALWGPSPVLGELLLAAAGFADPLHGPRDETAVDDLVRGLVEQLRTAGSQALSRSLAQMRPPGPPNGSHPL